ncbi:PREDICTED: uncharacterized protein LOC108580247 [Habropoda laboriosa]|uniref:uncharacterized protein LOC108580247 n=1 Tax=Habropoda laboriosa TaxID=597456 RepID=UPI00083D770F|nr:PREDICTED: uncharacterized protein LOC108580247 [Habropoda laboriosa]
MLPSLLHQFQIHKRRPLSAQVLRSAIVMRIHAIQVIAAILLIIGLCSTNTSGKTLPAEKDDAPEDEAVSASSHTENVDIVLSKKNDSKEEDREEDKLPILPPIILLDFANDTNEENVTAEEKSKRTVNSGLGYGLDKNNIQSRRYNYYFPAGKSGTTVSIEESVSPFLPKTIIERVQPSSQQGHYGTRQNSFDGIGQSENPGNYRYLNVHQTRKSVFGERTKPQQAAASSSFESYQDYLTTSRPPVSSFAIQNSGYRNNGVSTTTQSPLAFSATQPVRYVTPSPVKFPSPQTDSFNYPTRTYTGQRQNIQSNINSHGFAPVPQSVQSSTLAPLNYNTHFPSSAGQRYTVEDGIRYENKVFWKYPDGRVSDVPPATYVEYPSQSAAEELKSQGSHSIYESSSTENSILSQGPVQFPSVSEPTGQEPNPFVSSESLSSSLPQQQVYRLGYQNLVTQRQNVNLAQQRKPSSNAVNSYSFSSSPSSSSSSSSSAGRTRPNYESRYQQTTSRYMVNSPNPEYTDSYTTEPTIDNTTTLNRLRTSSNYYSPKTQNYLDTVLAEDEGSAKQSLSNSDLSSYSNLQYSDLLNYNPSISEYIRNPSSILNVRPTFVQAGNSLIPVIILRVDGASPIQSKAAQNINLKALLQQYLIQYAKSIQELAEPSTYSLGAESLSKGPSSGSSKSPVLDLIRLTQDDAREPPSYTPNSYIGRSSYETSNVEDRDFVNNRYVQGSIGRQKVKNVQILEDPRYPTYKAKN